MFLCHPAFRQLKRRSIGIEIDLFVDSVKGIRSAYEQRQGFIEDKAVEAVSQLGLFR